MAEAIHSTELVAKMAARSPGSIPAPARNDATCRIIRA
jgi:hypothetical protein